MSVTHQKMGIWPQNHFLRSMERLKTRFGVKSPFFHLKGPLLLSRVMIHRWANLFSEKKVGVTQQKMGIWPKKHLRNTEKYNFCHHLDQKDLQMGVLRLLTSFYYRIRPKKVFFVTFISKIVFRRCFLGQIPIFCWVTPTFFSLRRFSYQCIITLERMSGPFRWKNGDLTP